MPSRARTRPCTPRYSALQTVQPSVAQRRSDAQAASARLLVKEARAAAARADGMEAARQQRRRGGGAPAAAAASGGATSHEGRLRQRHARLQSAEDDDEYESFTLFSADVAAMAREHMAELEAAAAAGAPAEPDLDDIDDDGGGGGAGAGRPPPLPAFTPANSPELAPRGGRARASGS